MGVTENPYLQWQRDLIVEARKTAALNLLDSSESKKRHKKETEMSSAAKLSTAYHDFVRDLQEEMGITPHFAELERVRLSRINSNTQMLTGEQLYYLLRYCGKNLNLNKSDLDDAILEMLYPDDVDTLTESEKEPAAVFLTLKDITDRINYLIQDSSSLDCEHMLPILGKCGLIDPSGIPEEDQKRCHGWITAIINSLEKLNQRLNPKIENHMYMCAMMDMTISSLRRKVPTVRTTIERIHHDFSALVAYYDRLEPDKQKALLKEIDELDSYEVYAALLYGTEKESIMDYLYDKYHDDLIEAAEEELRWEASLPDED